MSQRQAFATCRGDAERPGFIKIPRHRVAAAYWGELSIEEYSFSLPLQDDVEPVAAVGDLPRKHRVAAVGWHERQDRVGAIAIVALEVEPRPAAIHDAAR